MKLLLLSIITTVLFTASLSLAQVKKIVSEKQESSITYQLTHPLHEIEAVSNEAYCDVYVDPTARQIKHVFVKVAVNTFNSGNSSRDSHAMEVIEAISFPESKFTSSYLKSNFWPTACKTFKPSRTTSGPVPSPGITPILYLFIFCFLFFNPIH